MIRKIIHIDEEKCIGCGLCASTCPEVVELNDDGKAQAVADTDDTNRDDVMAAIEGCPVSAIREEE